MTTEARCSRKPQRAANLSVLDVFCGAGGFSEGFRYVGCTIVSGIDHWQPAVDTFNTNFGVKATCRDVLNFERNPEMIDDLPDTDVIIGSPPCVSFSYSNKLGNADKTEGLRLIKAFLSIVAVKKFKRGSRLLAWYMENVANALDSLPNSYSFAALGLSEWATARGLRPRSIAIEIRANSQILNAADFGVAQTRNRLFVQEILAKRARRRGYRSQRAQLPTTQSVSSVRSVRSLLPATDCKRSSRRIFDPLDRTISIPLLRLTDHFYETGAYRIHWQDSRELKRNHPYMGRMAFPENEDRPSRTIVANQFPRSREAILYKSEWGRRGDGEYRGPTVREAASLMSFPITYQFVGTEKEKWKLVGNAVPPLVAKGLATQLLQALGKRVRSHRRRNPPKQLNALPNLNTFLPKAFGSPPRRRNAARFRSHASKLGSMTVALTNYDIRNSSSSRRRWRCFITYGIGEGYKIQAVSAHQIENIQAAIECQFPRGVEFIHNITNGFSTRIPSAELLQELYEENRGRRGILLAPNRLLGEAKRIIGDFANDKETIQSPRGVFRKKKVIATHLYALFAVCQIARVAALKEPQQ
jgi:DNA (cytosine-5)-methyltransferase 1